MLCTNRHNIVSIATQRCVQCDTMLCLFYKMGCFCLYYSVLLSLFRFGYNFIYKYHEQQSDTILTSKPKRNKMPEKKTQHLRVQDIISRLTPNWSFELPIWG